jgi:hypothetical protein
MVVSSPIDKSHIGDRQNPTIIIIHFNSINIFLLANLTAERRITKLARERRKKQQTKNLQEI